MFNPKKIIDGLQEALKTPPTSVVPTAAEKESAVDDSQPKEEDDMPLFIG